MNTRSFDTKWEQIHQQQDWGKYPVEEVIRFVARNYYGKDRSQIRILDAGCGKGAVAWFLAREGFDVYAFDGSPTAISKAETRLRAEGLQAAFTVCDAAHLPYLDNFFDAVIDSAMIYANRTAQIRLILRECHRVLKPGSEFFSTGLFKIGMTGYGTGERLEENTYRDLSQGILAGRGTVHFFDRQQISELWIQAGFQSVAIDCLERSDLGGLNTISYYMVEAQKA